MGIYNSRHRQCISQCQQREEAEMSAVEALKEMMSNWAKIEEDVKAQYPNATSDESYQMTAAVMNKSLGL